MKEKHYLIAYDISDNKRRNRIVKLLMNYAYRVQYSVFEFSATELIYRRIMDSVNQIIDSEEDSILIYELCESDWAKRIFLGVKKGEENIYEKKYAII